MGREIISHYCRQKGITGSGYIDGVSTHSLRESVTSLLIEYGVADSANTMRTGHRQIDSLRHYQNLREKEGQIQQNIIFDGFSENKPSDPSSSTDVKTDEPNQKTIRNIIKYYDKKDIKRK